jgi:hypothetical protein
MPTDDYTDDDQDDNDDEKSPAWYRKEIREANKRLAEAEERANANAEAARRVAFQDASIPDTPQTKFFREHYSGEWTPDAIREAAIANGFIGETSPASAESASQIALQADAAAGAEGTPAPGNMSEIEREMDEAAAKAPHGMEAKAIEEVWNRYNKSPADV